MDEKKRDEAEITFSYHLFVRMASTLIFKLGKDNKNDNFLLTELTHSIKNLILSERENIEAFYKLQDSRKKMTEISLSLFFQLLQ